MSNKGPSPKTAGIILAAGLSRRMGRPKQLLPVGGVSLICRILGEALSSRLDWIVVVLGYEAEQMQRLLAKEYPGQEYEIVFNDKYREGMASSIRAGIDLIKKDYDHAMIILADMVHIDAPLINRLLKIYLASGQSLGAVTIKGRRSHPVIFGRDLYPELLGLKGDKGGRDLFIAHEKEACLVPAPPEYREIDIDTPEDYRRLISLKNYP